MNISAEDVIKYKILFNNRSYISVHVILVVNLLHFSY